MARSYLAAGRTGVGYGKEPVTRALASMRSVALACVAATMLLPTSAFSQDAAYTQGRMDRLQRQIAELSSKLEQLKAQDQQLQQRLETMRAKFEARLERLEKGNAPAKGKPR